MKKGFKLGCLVLVVGFLAFAGLLLFIMFGSNTYETEDIAYYRAISGETDGPNSLAILGEQIDIPECPYELPYLSELMPYEDYRFHYTARRVSFFESHAYILIVQYEEAMYWEKKALLEAEFTWLTELIVGEEEGVSPEFVLDGFAFRAVEGGWYPKEMLFIGTSDESCEIAYVYFYDADLDYVSPTVDAFLIDETGWCEVVK